MSCMVMTKRHIDHVIDAIKFDSRNFQSNEPLYQQHVLALGAEFKTPMAEPLQYGEWESLLGGLIWKLNHDAYDDRYSHRDDIDFGYHETYRYTRTDAKLDPLTEPQAREEAYLLVKSIDVLIYNCMEGSYSDHGSLTVLSEIRDNIIQFIFKSDDRYDAAPWGIE